MKKWELRVDESQQVLGKCPRGSPLLSQAAPGNSARGKGFGSPIWAWDLSHVLPVNFTYKKVEPLHSYLFSFGTRLTEEEKCLPGINGCPQTTAVNTVELLTTSGGQVTPASPLYKDKCPCVHCVGTETPRIRQSLFYKVNSEMLEALRQLGIWSMCVVFFFFPTPTTKSGTRAGCPNNSTPF